MEPTVRISFIGDIMCEKPLQRAFEKRGAAVFDRVFDGTRELFGGSDLVAGNLETVFGGPELRYTHELYRFNTPDAFAAAMARGGIGLVTTATNHSLDCGTAGLKRTLDVLDANGIAHVGTRRKNTEPRVLLRKVGGVAVAFLNYTYGTNVHETGIFLRPDERFLLNLLKPQTLRLQTYEGKPAGPFRRAVSARLAKVADDETRIRFKRLLRMPCNTVRVDHLDPAELDEEYLSAIRDDLSDARARADVVIACLHCGGQFNAAPGGLSEYFAAFFAENGADAVVCHHAHVVQRLSWINGVPVAYCIGNYSLSPSSVYLLWDNLPQYSVALHLAVSRSGVAGASFSVLKTVEEDGVPTAYPADALFAALPRQEREALLRDVNAVRRRFSGTADDDAAVRRDYPIR